MASSSAKISFLLFLLTLLSSHQILARESQFFNKIPRNNDVVTEFEPVKQEQVYPLNNKPDQQEPNFLPEYENNNNGYGLYGHESGQLPPSTTTTSTATAAAINVGEPFKTTNHEYSSFPTSKYLPKNYNTEAYVTEAQGYTPTPTTVPENNNNNNDNPFSIPNSEYLPNNYNWENGNFNNYQQQQEQQERYSTRATGNNYGAGFVQKGYTTNPENNNNNHYYYGQNGNFKNNHQQEQEERYSASEATEYNNYGAGLSQKGYTTTGGGGSNNNNYNNNNNYYNGGNSNYHKQGMSDTRFLENGKYFYDSNLDKSNFDNVNLYENARGFGNSVVNSYDQYNNNAAMEGYQNYQFQDFHDEEDMP